VEQLVEPLLPVDSRDKLRGRIPLVANWASVNFALNQKLLSAEPSTPPFDGMDKILLLTWVRKKLMEVNKQPFVLHYWDLRPPNILLDHDQNIIAYVASDLSTHFRVIDWDCVMAVPLKLSAVSLEHMFIPETNGELGSDLVLNPTQSADFLTHLLLIQPPAPFSFNLSKLYLHSQENKFIQRIVLGMDLAILQKNYGKFFADAVERTPKALSDAASAWQWFESAWFGQFNRPVPDWPIYVEIREGLGIYGNTRFHRIGRKLKMIGQRQMLILLNQVCRIFPQWRWATRKWGYLKAALTEEYDWDV
jgi:hypothetical protein